MEILTAKKRTTYPFIDLCKALCIFLIVMNHLSGSYEHISYMKSFRIPLFFFAAGFLFSPQKYAGFGTLLLDRIKRLILPYFVYYTLSMAYTFIPLILKSPEKFSAPYFFKMLVGAFYSVGTADWMIAIPLWFLTCLFMVEMIYFAVSRRFKSPDQITGTLLGISIVGYALYFFDLPRLPWNLDVALLALPFFCTGNLGKPLVSRALNFPFKQRLCLALLLFILNYLGSQINDAANMNWRMYGHYLLFFLNGFTGISAAILLASLFPKSKGIEFIGRNTLTILGLHGLASLFILKVLTKFTGINVWNRLSSEWVGLGVTFLVFIALIPAILFINRFMPWLSGRKANQPIKVVDTELQAADEQPLQIHSRC